MLRAFAGGAPYPEPATNSACYSPITLSTASWLTAVYQYNTLTGKMDLAPESFGEAPAPTPSSFQQMFKWADNIFADSFM